MLRTLRLEGLVAAWRAAVADTPDRVAAMRRMRVNCSHAVEYDRWVLNCDRLSDADRARIRTQAKHLARKPLISIVMRAVETPQRRLIQTIGSIQAQLYPHWELCVVDDASPSEIVARTLREAAANDSRIKWVRSETKRSAATASNAALGLASGEFVALMNDQDLLPEHALYAVAVEVNHHPEVDLIYTDEDQVRPNGQRCQPYFKPDLNIDLLLGHDFFNHLGIYRRSLLAQIGGFRESTMDGSQWYDLSLRSVAVTNTARIRHIPTVLYHRRLSPQAFSKAQIEGRSAGARLVVLDYLKGQGVRGAEVLPVPAAPEWNRVRWPLPDPPPHVSLIVPTRDKPELLERCIDGLLQRTNYPDLDVLIVDNESQEPKALALLARLQNDPRVRVLPFAGPFNYSALNNAAVLEATGEIIVLLNNDIDVIDGDWLREMVSLSIRPDVGAVGAKLRFADDRIQHAGIVLGVGNDAVAGHFGYLAAGTDRGYFAQLITTRELSAVTGACLALRREVFDAVGGLDADHLPVQYNDVDLCLRIREHGWRVIWTPFAELYHLESASRGVDQTSCQLARASTEADYMRRRWAYMLDNDLFYNVNFDRSDHTFRLAMSRKKPSSEN
jgi:GT2 family glycosyltransferase